MGSGEVLPSVRPLKRSASTVSLPTPPRTQRRRRRNLRSTKDVSTDEDGDTAGEGPGGRVLFGSDKEAVGENARSHKRRKLSHISEDDDQDAFWAGVGEQASVSKPEVSKNSSSRSLSEPEMGTALADDNSDSETSFLSRRRMKQSMTTGSAPVSPPPSYRRPRAAKVANIKTGRAGAIDALHTVAETEEEDLPSSRPGAEAKRSANVSPVALTPSLPATPKTPKTPKSQIRSGISPMMLLRKSPDNPFLSSPESPSDSSAKAVRPTGKGGVYEEKPTIDLVFRGVRRAYPNPYYNHTLGRPHSPKRNSLLPPEHPDFSPDPCVQPRVLWPRKAKMKKARTDEIEEPTTPTKAKGRKVTSLLKSPPMTVKRTAGKVANAKSRSLIDSDDEDQKLDPEAVFPVRPLRFF
ncbi:hypothetical protein E1B28_003890 [Marasmius oreades]|uniref:Uncharacterized protein n=1 Tax=Marasmius oreades TaxID=181124 RepID=A0A9P7UXF5_9AGAR|nr:uncharacterized protein E1B28_003890 [Marasmius oreades]KAG7096456.1 hypothetical protein E1B28_003890 [Marasmius oreades]